MAIETAIGSHELGAGVVPTPNAGRKNWLNSPMSLFAICACVACSGYWFYAGEELGYPRWLGALMGWGGFCAMFYIWPGGWLPALGAQVAVAFLIGTVGAARLGRK